MPLTVIRKAARFFMADGGSVKTRVVRSGIWVGLSSAMGSLINLGRAVALARLLTPEVFGLMGLASIAIRALETATRPGVAQALISSQRDFDAAAPTGFTLLVARGVLLAIFMALVAPWIAAFYAENQLEPVLQALGLTFLIGSLVNINTIARQKELDFRRLTYIGQVTAIVGTIVTILVAYWLRSVWALVIGQVASVSINVLVSYWLIPGRVRFAFDGGVARELIGYGKFVTGSSIVLYFATEIDSAVIGKISGAEQLGYYTLAATMANLVTTNVAKMASSIMMPAYSKLQSDRPALRQAYLRTLSLVALVVMPVAAGLVLVAEPTLRLVFGEKWLPAAVPLQILAVFGLFRSLAAFAGYLFEGIGKPKVAFYLGVIRLAVIVPLIVPSIREYGLAGAAATVTLGIAVQWFVGLIFLSRDVQIRSLDVLASIWRPVWTTMLMSAVVCGVMLSFGVESVLGFLAAILSGVAAYGLLNASMLLALRHERLG